MPAAAVPGVAGAPPGRPLAEMVGGDGVADRGRSDPKAARFCGRRREHRPRGAL